MSEKKVVAKFKSEKSQFACCDKENSRYALANAEIRRAGKGTVSVTATDARCLSVVFTEGELSGADSVMCPAEIASGKYTRDNRECAVYGDEWRRGSTVATAAEGRFPNIGSILPDAGDLGGSVVLALNANILQRISQAIATNDPKEMPVIRLLLRFDRGAVEKPIVVLGDNGFGVLMPCEAGFNAVDRCVDTYKGLVLKYRDQAEIEEAPAEQREAVAAS